MHYDVSQFQNLAEAFFAIASAYPDAVVFGHAVKQPDESKDRPRPVRFSDYRTVSLRVRRIAAYLESIGVSRGAKVAIISGTRPEWLEADLAILSLGAVSVSVYHSLPAESTAYILFDSGAEYVFAENQEQVDKLLELAARTVYIPGHEDRAETTARINLRRIIAFEQVSRNPLTVQLEWIGGTGDPPPSQAGKEIGRSSLATLVYTSGTTGPPKGVIQTHGNHLANMAQAYATGLVTDNSVIFLFLPLAHSFARLLGYLGVFTPIQLRFPAVCDRASSALDKQSLVRDMRESDADIVALIPRMLEKMQEKMGRAAAADTLRGRAARLVFAAARKRSDAKAQSKWSPAASALFALTSPLRARLRREIFGRNFRFCICGAAKLSIDTSAFFESLGIDILEGYGLTETCVANTINRLENRKPGSVGKPLADDIEIKIADDGEVLIRGPNVSKGYYQRPTATAAAWTPEGWFRTGDMGELDADGNLTIVGRKKELIVSSNGKKIASFDIEKRMSAHPLIAHCVLVGENRPYCVAIFALDPGGVRRWQHQHETALPGPTPCAELHQEIGRHVEECNRLLANFEQVKKFFIAPEEFSIERGLLTPTLKVKRQAAIERYAAEIDAMYDEKRPDG